MVPLDLFRSRTVSAAIGFYGLPFVLSLYLQQLRSLSSLATGVAFLPMMLMGAVLTPFSAHLAERLGARRLIAGGLILMTAGLVALAVVTSAAPVWILALLMVLVGLAGPLVMPPLTAVLLNSIRQDDDIHGRLSVEMPPLTAVLLNSIPSHRAGTASGVFNTSRQIGGALVATPRRPLLRVRGPCLRWWPSAARRPAPARCRSASCSRG